MRKSIHDNVSNKNISIKGHCDNIIHIIILIIGKIGRRKETWKE